MITLRRARSVIRSAWSRQLESLNGSRSVQIAASRFDFPLKLDSCAPCTRGAAQPEAVAGPLDTPKAQVWNEIEHGLVYAGTGETSPEEQAALHAFGRLTEAGDALVSVLLTASARRLSQPPLQAAGRGGGDADRRREPRTRSCRSKASRYASIQAAQLDE